MECGKLDMMGRYYGININLSSAPEGSRVGNIYYNVRDPTEETKLMKDRFIDWYCNSSILREHIEHSYLVRKGKKRKLTMESEILSITQKPYTSTRLAIRHSYFQTPIRNSS